jgi:hypothetical protein
MKLVGDFEKSVIRILLQGGPGSRNIVRIIAQMKVLDGVSVDVDLAGKTIRLIFQCAQELPTEDQQAIAVGKTTEIIELLTRLMGFISYLEKKHLLFCYVSAKGVGPVLSFGGPVVHASPLEIEICDPGIVEMLADWLCKEIVLSPGLNSLARIRLPLATTVQRRGGRGVIWTAALLVFLVVVGSAYLVYRSDHAVITQMNNAVNTMYPGNDREPKRLNISPHFASKR